MNISRPSLRDSFWMPATVLIAGLAMIALFPRLSMNHGFGWDGVIYGRFAASLVDEIAAGNVNAYYLGRTLPSAAVYVSLKLLRLINYSHARAYHRSFSWAQLFGANRAQP